MRFYIRVRHFDAIIRYKNTQRNKSEHTLRSCLLVNAGRSKHVNTWIGSRTQLYTVIILETWQKIGTLIP